MPFRSKRQMRFMFAQHPDVAKRWAKEYGTTGLPESASKKDAHRQALEQLRRRKR